MSKTFLIILYCWGLISVAFLVLSVSQGGTAQTGRVADGRYYLGQHGHYTEVSRHGYLVSAIATGIWGLLGLFTLGAFMQSFARTRGGYTALLHPVVIVGILIAGFGGWALSCLTWRCITGALP